MWGLIIMICLLRSTTEDKQLTHSPVFVNDGIECKTVTPAGGEVSDVDIGISRCFHLAP